MKSWKAAFITLAIFGLGGLAGSLITAQIIKTKVEQVQATAPPPQAFEVDYLPRMAHVMEVQLNLTPEQVKSVRAILRQAQQNLRKLNEEWQLKAEEMDLGSPRLMAARTEWRIKSRRIFVQSDDEVRSLLTKEQFPLWEEFVRRRRAALQQNRPPGGGFPPRPPERQDGQGPPAAFHRSANGNQDLAFLSR